MKKLKLTFLFVFMLALAASSQFTRHAESQQRFTEAATGFDKQSNGLSDQATFDHDRETFEERDDIEKGLGPVYNAQGCVECHQNPITGAGSQVAVLRAGHRDAQGNFVEAPGGSLINDRAIDPAIQEFVPPSENIRTFRMSLSLLGDGYVEAIDDNTLIEIARQQAEQTRGQIAGQISRVPVTEAPGVTRVGRFGWKNQHASLLSFSADAYLNEIGVTSRLEPHENTALGLSLKDYDKVADPEDRDNDIDVFTNFMRATKAPARDVFVANSPEARMGAQLFNQIGCTICHVPNIVTAPAGTPINGGMFSVPPALGSKLIHPYGDFLLHDVATGDGIVQNGGPTTANKLRTPPLWGLRTRNRFMHDGLALTYEEAITRHGGEAASVRDRFRTLSPPQRQQLLRFLRSL